MGHAMPSRCMGEKLIQYIYICCLRALGLNFLIEPGLPGAALECYSIIFIEEILIHFSQNSKYLF